MKRLAPLAVLALTACGPVVSQADSIDLSALKVDNWRGVSLNGDRLHLVAEGRGILEIGFDGELLTERNVGEAGLLDEPYRDVAALDFGYVLLADDQGFLYDPAAQTETVHFCVLPGDVIMPSTQKNDAVTVSGDVILASPRFYDGTSGELQTSELRTYRLSDGEPTSVVPLEQPLELRGLAVTLDGILGVDTDRVYRLDDTGRVLGEVAVTDLGSAVGIAADSDRAFILDEENDRIAIVLLEDL